MPFSETCECRIKTSVEDAYFRYKGTGKFQTTIENCIDVESMVVNLELDRVGFMKKISPSGHEDVFERVHPNP